MLADVELHPSVVAYLATVSPAERKDFFSRLDEVRREPIGRSDRHQERSLSPYALRHFAFGVGVTKIAIFEYDLASSCMRILRCRLRKPREWRRPTPAGGELPKDGRE